MPTVALLNGIKLEMFYGDHPPPHIHASSAEYELLVNIADGTIYEGSLPGKLQRKVLEYVRDPDIENDL